MELGYTENSRTTDLQLGMSVVFLLSMIDLDSYRLIIGNRPTGAEKMALILMG